MTVNSVASPAGRDVDTASMVGKLLSLLRASIKNTSPQRAFLWVAMGGFAALCFGAWLMSRYLMSTYDTLEAEAAHARSEQMLQAFRADASQLEVSNHDYAVWDEAERFIRDRNPEFLAANITSSTLGNLRVDYLLIVDRNGTEVLTAYLDRDTRRLVTPATPTINKYFMPYARNPRELMRRPSENRVLNTDRGAAMISAFEISRSDGTLPTGAVMLFARFIKAAEIERISLTSTMRVGIVDLRKGSTVAGSDVKPAVAAWLARGAPRAAAPLDFSAPGRVTSVGLLTDPQGSGSALMSVAAPRTIHDIGVKATALLLGSVLGLALAFGTALLLLFMRLHRSLRAHQSVESRYRSVAAQLGESIVMVDAITHRIVDSNEAVLGQLKYTRAEICTRTARDIFPDLELAVLKQAANPDAGRVICMSRMRRSDGTFSDSEISITYLVEHGQNLLCLVGHDVSHRKAAEDQARANQRKLLHLAQHDPLTNLPNRLFLRAKLPRVLKTAADNAGQLALVYLDIDHFKNINDSRGHGFGDKLLQIVAQRLRSTVGTQDAVVRMGGDEFVIVASLVADNAALDSLATRLQTAISAPISIDGNAISVTASIGVSVYPRDGLDLEILLKHADIALYQAKEAGRSCHRLFVPDMDVRVSEDVALEQALRHAVGSEQFFMEYQPVVDLASNRVTSFEALMRWRHPEMGLIPPSRFIPIAEKSGLIIQLGQQAVGEVLKQLRVWLDSGLTCYPVNVNVAPQQLMRTDFPALVKQLADETAMEAAWLRFEITESAFLQNPERMVSALHQLREMGSHILIDDFGTGYSALSYLAQLPIDTLKIDRSFVIDMDKGGAGGQIISAVIDMAKRLKLFTVAEGVETREQAHKLRDLGCHYAQGYVYSKPLSARRTKLLLEKVTAREQKKKVLQRQKLAG